MSAKGKGQAPIAPQLKPQDKALKSKVIQLDIVSIVKLEEVFNQISMVNGAVPQSVGKWIAKNTSGLISAHKLYNDAFEKDVKDAYWAPLREDGKMVFAQKGSGEVVYTDETKETVLSGDRIIESGDRDERGNPIYVSIYTGKQVVLQSGGQYFPLLKDESLRSELDAKIKELDTQLHDVTVYQIHESVIELVAIPTARTNQNPLDLTALYAHYIIEAEESKD